MTDLRARIEADLAEETRRVRVRSIFATRDAARRPPSPAAPVPVIPDSGVRAVGGTPDDAGEGSDGFDFWHAAQSDYEAVCENQTGVIIPEQVFEEGRFRRAQQDETTVWLAKTLDQTGRYAESPYYKGEHHPDRVTVIGLMTGVSLPTPPVKRSNVLPSIQKAARSKMLREIEHFIATLWGTGRKAAMFTITNGPRVPLGVKLREEIQDFHRWLSKMAKGPAFKRWGLEMQWRATEFGQPKWQHDPSSGMDQMTLHLHAHCLVTLPEKMTNRQRKKMRKKLWQVFGTVWDDAGDIQNPREFVKYPVKDSDLRTIITEAGAGAFADFCDSIRGLHIVQPMGELRERRGVWKANARRATAFNRLDGRTLEETGDWNASKRPLAPPNERRAEYRKRALAMAARMACADHCMRLGTNASDHLAVYTPQTPVQTADDGDGSSDPDEKQGEQTPRPKNRVIALLAPAPYGSPILEPGVVVWGFDGNLAAVLNQPRVAAIIARHRRAFDDAAEARALIRACAGALASNQSSQRSNNCPADLGDLALLDAENRPPGYIEPAFST